MVKITLSIEDDALWLEFRKACLDHKTSASKAIEQLMRELLARFAEAKGDKQAANEQYEKIMHSMSKSIHKQALLTYKKEK